MDNLLKYTAITIPKETYQYPRESSHGYEGSKMNTITCLDLTSIQKLLVTVNRPTHTKHPSIKYDITKLV